VSIKCISVLSVILVFFVAGSVLAFDGQRKGPVLGIGFGAGSAHFSGDASAYNRARDVSETEATTTLQILLGWGIDQRNIFAVEMTVSVFKSKLFRRNTVAEGITGLYWYHYFGREGRSWFINMGVGRYVFNPEDFPCVRGPGLLIGGGYEITRHGQVRLAAMFARTERTLDHRVIDLTHRSVILTFSCFAY
jgi:hypothetical protein